MRTRRAVGSILVVALLTWGPPAAASPTPLATLRVGISPPAATGSGYPAVVGVAVAAGGASYADVRIDGRVDVFGRFARVVAAPPAAPGVSATGIAADPRTGGYWVLFSNGRVEAIDAPALGGPRIPGGGWGQYPAAVAIAAAPRGRGYLVLRANGAVDAFGTRAHGSLAHRLAYGATAPVTAVGIAVDAATGGYWIATSSGAVVAFDAPALGAPSLASPLSRAPTVALAAAGSGVVALEADGHLSAYGTSVGPAAVAVPAGAAAAGIAVAGSRLIVAIDDGGDAGYRNPLRAVRALVPQEIDQGVDYCGSGPVYALGPGVVLNVTDPGWPSGTFIAYRLTAGPAVGRVVYVAENVTPHVRIGQRVTMTTAVGVVRDFTTCLETGWASPTRLGWALGATQYTGKNSTAFGRNFSALLETVGARPGLTLAGPRGRLPAGWPRWPAGG